ncbi:MerR family transcriptional regulator [Gordonia sp. CPCC 205333]|uniref:MerR family transcriptional regulator n=1 Tax=Gordonia sp. CPCC 205333 TaxID=3140790 RepID=UPI003AF38FD2
MTTDHLTIGTFARVTGLTSSALRFYDDSGLLAPADVDESSGYRYYSPEQVSTAQLIRQLRETGMSLGDIRAILDDPDPAGTTRRIDDHLAELARRLADATAAAAQIKSAARGDVAGGATSISGPLFASACDQVLPATLVNPELPVLDSVFVEVGGGELTLTATDRYRLASRSLSSPTADSEWSAAVAASAIRTLADWARRQHRISLHHNGTDVVASNGTETRHAPTLGVTYPDYRLMLRSLPAVATRAAVSRKALLDLLERGDRLVSVAITDTALSVGDDTIVATVTGQPITIAFDVTVLHPTVATAIGEDVLLDIAAEDQPVQVRSADDGGLITLAMPVRIDG